MTVHVPGNTTLTGRPATILRLLISTNVVEATFDYEGADNQAERILRELARDNKITIEEE